MPAASNSGATSPIAAHYRLVLIAARGNHPHRAHAGRADISSRNCLTQPPGLLFTSLPGAVMLSRSTMN